jgi:hypothetical protein
VIEHPNCQAVEEFLEAIPSIARPIAKTERLDGVKVPNAYTAAWHDQATNSGFTVIAMGDGHMKLFVELTGKISNAAEFAAAVNRVFFSK